MFGEIRARLRQHQFKVLLWGLILVIVWRAFAGVEEEFGEGIAIIGLILPALALISMSQRGARLAFAGVLAAAAMGSSAGVLSGALSVRQAATLEANLAFMGFTTAVVFAAVFRSPRVTGDVLAGAIAGYILLGLSWAGVHALVETYRPHSYHVALAQGPLSFNDLTYFSFVTLMSIGFGDITPVSDSARALVICEGITGVAFNTIVLALLVSKYLAHSERPPRQPSAHSGEHQ